PLTTRKREAAFTENRFVPVRKRGDELRGAGELSGMLDVGVVGVGAGEADVLADGIGEQERLFEHERDRAPYIRQPQLANVVTVDEHSSRVRVVEAREQACHRALS